MKSFLRLLQFVLPVLVLALSGWLVLQIINSPPQAKRRSASPQLAEVEAVRLQTTDYQVVIQSQGIVQARTETTLMPELNGRIVALSDNFENGGFFKQGSVLVQIDPRDYKIAVTIAEAELARAKASLAEEQARAQVAKRDWQQLKRQTKTANPLVLRKPQVAAARASVAAAQAQLARAKLNLERTHILAPYTGRVLEQNVGLGQYVAPGTVLARIYAVDYVEIRLPLSNRQLAFLNLPEHYLGENVDNNTTTGYASSPVTVSAQIGATDYQWQGRIDRVEGAIDAQSRQLFVVARVDAPYAKPQDVRPPLRLGQFVNAQIRARLLRNVFVLPRAALREGDQVLLVDAQNQLQARQITVIWGDAESVVVSEGLQAGDSLVVTPLSIAAEGTPVNVRWVTTQTDVSDSPSHNATDQRAPNPQQTAGQS